MAKHKSADQKLHTKAPKPELPDSHNPDRLNYTAPQKGTNANNQYR